MTGSTTGLTVSTGAAVGGPLDTISAGVFLLSAQFPGQGHTEALDRTVAAAVAAEQAGLDGVWLAEHHFVPYGVCPSAATLAALLLGRTRRIGVGTAVSVLSTCHPVALGEQAALLHLTSGGRFTLGVGRGGPWVDLDVFGTGLAAFEKEFPERLDLLLRWLRGSRVGADGPGFAFPEVPVVPRATERPVGRAADQQGGRRAGQGRRSSLPGPWAGTPFPRQRADSGPRTEPGSRAASRSRKDPVPRAEQASRSHGPASAGPPVVVACTSLASLRLAAERGLPMLLGMHCGDEEKREMTDAYRTAALDAGHPPKLVARLERGHLAAGVVQVADSTAEARSTLLRSMPEWFRNGLGAHRTVDGRERRMRDPHDYTELLCDLHAVGTPKLCADRLLATTERTGIRRFALMVEGSGDHAATLRNVTRLGAEVVPLLR
jgi:alkanesulfonate monooxygenase SsuD/methylene tetrahydromethanopterin reductase-like flavin-dependent oxidoreductase (luciferase family)